MSIKLEGNWEKGFAYDVHTLSSNYLGIDEQGHDRWENERSEMGECVYQLKYRGDVSQVEKIVSLLSSKFRGFDAFDLIVPVPASQSRSMQPVYVIAEKLAKEHDVVYLEVLTKQPAQPLKNIEDSTERLQQLKSTMRLNVEPADLNGKKVLLIDDLYRSGATLSMATDILYQGGCEIVCVIAMTKTRSNR